MRPRFPKIPRRAALLAVLALLLATRGGAETRRFGRNPVPADVGPWRAIAAGHVQVCFHPGEDSLAWRTLDLAVRTDGELMARLGRGLPGRVTVILAAPSAIVPAPGPLEVGLGGARALLRQRTVIPFDGSYEDLRRTLVHRLTHVVLRDLPGGRAGVARRGGALPAWFVEGLAEYLALGMDPDAEALVREATIEDELPPLGWSGGYIEYKQGQAAVAWLVARRGPHVIRQLLADVARGRSFGRAFTAAAGTAPGPFEERWREHLRRRYWPEIARRQRPEAVARRLVDSWNGDAYRTQPVVSPQGDRVACFADHGPFTDVEILSVARGRVLRRMARVPRAFLFERVPATRRGIAWSPDGKRLAVAGAERGPVVTIVSEQGEVLRRLTLPCASVAYPAWSPAGDSLVVAGVRGDRSDLWLVGVTTGRLTRLTNDAWDEREPDFTPDGTALAFASDRGAPLVLAPGSAAAGRGGLGLYRLDLAGGGVTPIVDGRGNERSPAWSPDGRRLAFIADADGTPNLWLVAAGDTARVRLTRLLGGAQALSWSRQDDRLVFSAYDHFGFDLFAVKEPLSVPGALDRLRNAAAALDSLSADSSRADTLAAGARPDSTAADSARAAAAASPGTYALSAAALAQRPRGPRGALAPEEAGLALYDAPDLGFVVGAQLGLRNLLGNRSLYLAADVFTKKPEDSQGLVTYRRLVRRFDLGVGAFRYVNGFAPPPGTFGEQMTGLRLAPQRTYGAFAGAGFAFGRSVRLEANLRQMEVAAAQGAAGTRPATSPALSLVHDNTVAGALGPVTGRRLNLTFVAALPARPGGLEYQTFTLDARRYADWTRGYSFAGRLLGGASAGRDAQTFVAGGFATLRGRPDWALTGTRAVIGNAEVRFPFLQRLGILGPVAVGTINTRGVVFVDAGSVWDTGEAPRVLHEAGGHPALDEVALGFGTGFRAVLPFTIFKADVAWSTDFNAVSRPRWYVSLGPDY